MSDEELGTALRSLVGDDQGYPPDTFVPLYRRPDGAKVAAAMPVFDGCGLVPPVPSKAHVVTALVMVSFGDFDGEEEQDSEATWEGAGETSPSRKADLLCTLPNDDDTGDHLVREVLPPAGVTTRSRVTP